MLVTTYHSEDGFIIFSHWFSPTTSSLKLKSIITISYQRILLLINLHSSYRIRQIDASFLKNIIRYDPAFFLELKVFLFRSLSLLLQVLLKLEQLTDNLGSFSLLEQ